MVVQLTGDIVLVETSLVISATLFSNIIIPWITVGVKGKSFTPTPTDLKFLDRVSTV